MVPDPNSPLQSPSSPSTSESASQSLWQRWWHSQRDNVRLLAVALAIALLTRMFIAEPRFIPSNSMEPTLAVGDRLIVEKVSYRLGSPHPKDVIVFQPPQQLLEWGYRGRQAFIKRIIAVPGQTVSVQRGRVYVDGQPLEEDYILEPPQYQMDPIYVPEGHVFVMGDNRNDSNDSHVWGVLPQDNIIGRAQFRFWPLDRLGSLG